MKDLTKPFLNALAKNDAWGEQDVWATAQKLGSARFDWEPGDESWGRLLKDGEEVALICAKVPLLFVVDSLQYTGIDEERIEVYSFSTLDEIVSVELSALEKIFGDDDIASQVDFSSLTVLELWWATV